MYHKNLAIFLVPVLTWSLIRSVNLKVSCCFLVLFVFSFWVLKCMMIVFHFSENSPLFYMIVREFHSECVYIWQGLWCQSHMVSEPWVTLEDNKLALLVGCMPSSFPPRYLCSCRAKVPSFSFAFQALSLLPWFAFMDGQSRSRKISHCHSLLSLPTLSELPWNWIFTNNFWLIWECRSISLAVFLCTKKINWDSQFQQGLLPIWA